ncbi:IucA/IucC family protein [Streptomyces acidiscabies]|uniref:IucA/IucC family protein n=1 Tax=Streptomyces acidiscabies TaxID=42234 RepID=UPI002115DA2C|nr:IucA/IucC family protein [Streptomyces acidiscabies]
MTAHPPTADAYAATPLLNCLLREVAEPTPEPGVHRLPSGRLLRVRGERRPTEPELVGGGGSRLGEGADCELGGGSELVVGGESDGGSRLEEGADLEPGGAPCLSRREDLEEGGDSGLGRPAPALGRLADPGSGGGTHLDRPVGPEPHAGGRLGRPVGSEPDAGRGPGRREDLGEGGDSRFGGPDAGSRPGGCAVPGAGDGARLDRSAVPEPHAGGRLDMPVGSESDSGRRLGRPAAPGAGSGPQLSKHAAPARPLDHPALVALVAEELRLHTGLDNPDLPAEMLDSREVVAAILGARALAAPPQDPYRRSEQSLVTGHPYHPAPKARGGGPAARWLPYAPEAYAAFPLILLGVREDQVVEEGDVSALDELGEAPPGYRLLPAHPWQLDLLGGALQQAVAEKWLIQLGTTTPDAWPTAAIRTVYTPAHDLFLKFSLDVRITNDIRRLWAHDLRKLRRTDEAAARALPGVWLSDRGYRTAAFAFEELAVLVRDGFGDLTATPLLAAALAEGFDGNPLAATTDPEGWWTAYLRAVVQPAVTGFTKGVVLEAHAQNTLIVVDAEGTPVQALYRDAEGVKLLTDVDRAAGWERLVYTLVVNHLAETAAALAEHHPGFAPWPAVRRELERYDLPEAKALLSAPTLPGKTNLLLRWTRADGADARYLPLPNPLASP